MTAPLRDGFDTLLFDLDGVVYVGPSAVPHAAEEIAAARGAGLACAFITNNASRSPESVAEHLSDLGIPATPQDVVTSPQAAVSLLPGYVADGSAVLVIGGPGIAAALAAAGYRPVSSLEEAPAAVLQGFSPDLSWRDLALATFAVRSGLPWIATNPDLTFPAPGGIAPGNGALVRVVAETVGRGPDAVAGKPEPPLLHEAMRRFDARRPLMIGDRLDTDIAAGARVDVPTLLVFTGVCTLAELFGAIEQERPTYLGPDLTVLSEPYPPLRREGALASCGSITATVEDGVLRLAGDGAYWDAVRAAAAACWGAADEGVAVDVGQAVSAVMAGYG